MKMILNAAFFLMPFLFYLGIAVQGVAFYLLCLFLPFFLFLRRKNEPPQYFLILAVSLISLYAFFPFVNLVTFLLQKNGLSETIVPLGPLSWSVLKSDFPSSFLFGGLFFLLFFYLGRKNRKNGACDSCETGAGNLQLFRPMSSFLSGLSIASVLFLCALLYQHVSGVEFRSHSRYGAFLTPDNLLPTGGFRVYGFYGHPLTVAGVSLAYASFAWAVFWQMIAGFLQDASFLPFFRKKALSGLILFSIAVANASIVFLTGGRTATVIVCVVFALLPFVLCFRRKPFLATVTLVFVCVGAVLSAKRSGVLERLYTVEHAVTSSATLDQNDHRLDFWKTYTQMFFDKPLLGQGNFWIKEGGVRDAFYDRLGLANLDEKYNAHNNYLEILASVGIFGFLWIFSILVFLWSTLKKRVLRNDNGLAALRFPVFVMVGVNLAHAFTQNVYFDSSVVYIYLEVLCVLLWQAIFLRQPSAPRP